MPTKRENTDGEREGLAERQVRESIHTHWRLLLIQGLIMVALGVAAVVEPMIAALAVEIFVGWLLLGAGMLSLTGTITGHPILNFRWALLGAFLSIATGLFLIARPFGGVVSLTLAAAIFFGAQGIAQFIVALSHRAVLVTWTWILLSSLVNFGLLVVILSGTSGSGGWTLGLMFGINLFIWGLALVMTALASRTVRQA